MSSLVIGLPGEKCMEGDSGVGAQEKRGQEVYGRWGKKGTGSGIPKVVESTTLCYILQSKKCTEAETNKVGWELGLKGMGGG